MTTQDQKQTCPECGLEMRSGAGEVACPGCSLRLALSPDEATLSTINYQRPSNLQSRFFGDYEILQEIARGGMGVVYRARQLGINRIVALKMVQANHLLSDEARLRFRVEIEAVAQLHHPHIVPLYESGEHDGSHYFTMRLVEGGDLAGDLKRERPVRERVKMLILICQAVHYAHQRGILHRDLKPSNILLDEQGSPHVADFGLAKSLDGDSGFTFTSSVLGSPNYMAPEQAAGQCRQLTTAVDVYGLGAILYHVLAGRPPFQAATPIETLRQVVDQAPPPPHRFNGQVDRDLETIALKCLRKEPTARYGTAEQLAQDLERWLTGRPIQARPVSLATRVWLWSRRHPAAALLGLGLVVAVTGFVVSTGVAAVKIRKAERHAAELLSRALVGETRALRIRGEWGRRAEGLRLLREAVPLTTSNETRRQARNELLALLPLPDLTFVPDPNVQPSEISRYQLDSRMERSARVEQETNVVIRLLADGSDLHRFSCSDGPIIVVDQFSSDSRFLALRHAEALTIWEVATGRCCWRQAGTNVVFSFGVTGQMVVQTAPNEAAFVQLPSGREVRRWVAEEGRPAGRSGGWHSLALSPNGRMVAGASAISPLVEWMDGQTGQVLQLLTNSPRTTAMSWSPGGNRFAVATGGGRIFVWLRGAHLWTSQSLPGRAHSVEIHPRDQLLALACEDRRIRIIDLDEFRIVHETIGESRGLKWSPDGLRLGPVLIENRLGWLETSLAREFVEFDAGVETGRSSDCRFSADGRWLLAGAPGIVALCDPVAGRAERRFPSWRISATSFHPDGRELLTGNSPGILRFAVKESITEMFAGTNYTYLNSTPGWRALDFSYDGRWLAAFNGRSTNAFVFDRTLTNCVAELGPHWEAEDITISPDGRWVGTGSYADQSIRIWDVSRQALERAFLVGPRPQSAFSTDGKWLATFGDTFGLWEVGSWKAAPPLPFPEGEVVLGAAAFSSDSQYLAVIADLRSVHLFGLDRFEPLGILRASGGIRLRALAFSPDGTKLAGVGSEGRVAVWHLNQIRRRLLEFGLNWPEPRL